MLDVYEANSQEDELLYVLSARQQVSYRQFKDIVENLYLSQSQAGLAEDEREEPVAYIVAQALEALGHCDFDFESGKSEVYIAPPVLARLPLGGPPRAVLAGARSPDTFPLLAKACEELGGVSTHISSQEATAPLVPLRISVQAKHEELLVDLADKTGINYESYPAYRIARALGTLDEYLETRPSPKSGQLEGWLGRRDYAPEALRFLPGARLDVMRLSRYMHPTTQQQYFFLFRDGKRVEIDRDWGRYIVLRDTALKVIAYDSRRALAAIPIGARLPGLHSRALCLCSGYAPVFLEEEQLSISSRLNVPKPEQHGYHLYRWVPPGIVEEVARKLDQHSLKAKISH